MKLNLFKKKESRPRSSFKKYDSIARQRKKNLYTEKFKSINPGVKFPKKFLIIPAAILLIVGIFVALSSSTFRVKDIYVSGDDSEQASIVNDLDSIKGRNIFLLRSSEIFNKLKDKYSNIESVYVYKYMPDRIEVEIVESFPSLVFSSFSKTTLVKRDGSSLGDIKLSSELKLLDYEMRIVKGERDLEAKYLQDKFLSDLADEARKDFKWESVTPEEKESKYNALRDDIMARVNQYSNGVKQALLQTDFKDLPFYFSYVPYEDSGGFFADALEITDGMNYRNLKSVDNTFTSEYTLVQNTDDGKQILFSTQRPISDQFKDLDSIIFYGRYSGAKIIDLRSNKYSITRWFVFELGVELAKVLNISNKTFGNDAKVAYNW